MPLLTAKRRPIGLYSALVRVWASARKRFVYQWLRGIAHPAFGTDRGCAAADTVWRGVVRACAARERGQHAAEALADITKCFENVPYERLIARATELGFPPQILRLSIRSYRWERRITDGVA